MAMTAPFDALCARYDAWFERHDPAYRSELETVRSFLPREGRGLEVGVGTGRFAAPLGIGIGLDPSMPMLALAARRGVHCARAAAEALPFRGGAFDFVLGVTVICFVRDARRMLAEMRRVLRPGGALVLAFLDRASPGGGELASRKGESPFYRDATFYSAAEVGSLLEEEGFAEVTWAQTLTRPFAEIREPEPPMPGHGQGTFCLARARKPPSP